MTGSSQVQDGPPADWQQQLAEVASYGRFDTVLRVIDGWRTQPPAYRHDVDYLADQLRQYIDGVIQEGVDYMREHVGDRPALAERLRGYEDAMEDVQKMLRDPSHQFHRGLRRYITGAREVSRG